MTIYFPSHTITILRYKQKTGILRGLSATFTAYDADIQPVTDSRVDLFGGRVGKTYVAWVNPDVAVEEGDIISSGGKRYAVRTVSTYEGAGLLDHKELIIIAQD